MFLVRFGRHFQVLLCFIIHGSSGSHQSRHPSARNCKNVRTQTR